MTSAPNPAEAYARITRSKLPGAAHSRASSPVHREHAARLVEFWAGTGPDDLRPVTRGRG